MSYTTESSLLTLNSKAAGQRLCTVSKRLTANVFHESEVQGPAQLMPSTPKQPASYGGEITSSTITATSTETSAPIALSTSHDRGSGLEL